MSIAFQEQPHVGAFRVDPHGFRATRKRSHLHPRQPEHDWRCPATEERVILRHSRLLAV